MRLDPPGWRVVNSTGNPRPNYEVERQRARIMWTPLVRRDREHRFCEYLVTDDAGVVDPQLPILAKVSSLLEVMRLGGSYEPVEQLWAQFSLTTSCVNIEVCWSRNEVLFSICIFSVSYTYLIPGAMYPLRKFTYLFNLFNTDVLLSVNFAKWNVPTDLFAGRELREIVRPVQC